MAVSNTFETLIPRSYLRTGRNHLGKAIFARHSISEGELICRFGGTLFHIKELPARRRNTHDYFLQVGDFVFLGKSKNLDDYMNHSCDPSCGLLYLPDGIYLKALRDISHGEEITYDYSTTMWQTGESMRCKCRSSKCREVVQDFDQLPEEIKVDYLGKGIVLPFIRTNHAYAT